MQSINDLKRKAKNHIKFSHYRDAEDTLNHAISRDEAFTINNPSHHKDFELYYLLGNLHYSNSNYKYAADCYNNAINILSDYIYSKKNLDLKDIKKFYDIYSASKQQTDEYNQIQRKYESKTAVGRLLGNKPKKPNNYDDYKKYSEEYNLYQNIQLIIEMFNKLANICEKQGEIYPAKVCKAAAKDISLYNNRGNKILELRSQGIYYIGDLYPEIRR